jgi:hypothetical protein
MNKPGRSRVGSVAYSRSLIARFLFLIEATRLYIDGLTSEDVKVAIQMLIDEMEKPTQKNSTQKLMEAKGEPPTSKAVVSAAS